MFHSTEQYLEENFVLVKRTKEEVALYITGQSKNSLNINGKKQSLDQKNEVYDALKKVSPVLANSYSQVKQDIQDETRISWAGTAHEIREITGTLLRTLAPNDVVKKQSWYKQETNNNEPSQKQRVHFIMKARHANSKEEEVAEQITTLDGMIEDLIRAFYSRASVAAHTFMLRGEVVKILRYFEAFAHDLLDIE